MTVTATVDNLTRLGGKSLHEVLETLIVSSMELLDRGELTPNMLTQEEVDVITKSCDLYLVMIDKLIAEEDDE